MTGMIIGISIVIISFATYVLYNEIKHHLKNKK